jgi:hypothetical protein
MDLFAEGLETVVRREVSPGGFIDLPLLTERVRAEGLSAEEVAEAVKSAYKPNIIKEPTVAITVLVRHQSTFSILGAIARPGTYNIIRRDMRLLDALALAGDVSQVNIRYLYIFRLMPAVRKEAPAPAVKPGTKGAEAAPEMALPPLPEIPESAPGKGVAPGTAPAAPATREPSARPPGGGMEAALEELDKALAKPPSSTKPSTVPKLMQAAPTTKRPASSSGSTRTESGFAYRARRRASPRARRERPRRRSRRRRRRSRR